MRSIRIVCAAILAGGLTAPVSIAPALAAPIGYTVDFTTSGTGLGTGDLGLATATLDLGGGIGLRIAATGGDLTRRNGKGLGVGDAPAGGNVGRHETLSFELLAPPGTGIVLVDSVVFERHGRRGRFRVLRDGTPDRTISWADESPGFPNDAVDLLVTHPLNDAGSIFEFVGLKGAFRVAGLTFAVDDPPTISALLADPPADPLPEPGMLFIFGLGLMVLGLFRRRRTVRAQGQDG